MKKIIIATLLSLFVVAPAIAAESKSGVGEKSIGVNYGLDMDGVLGIQGEFDISSMVENAPISVQVFWKRSSEDTNVIGFTNNVTTSALGVAGIYDFSSVFKVKSKRLKPYAGLGIRSEKAEVKTSIGTVSRSDSELHLTAGVKYSFNRQFAADFNFNDFGGITVGANFSF